MKSYAYIFLFFTLLISGCKKTDPVTEVSSSEAPVSLSLLPECKSLPAPPDPFGWVDSSQIDDKNVNAFVYNPINANEILYIVNGDAFEQNKIYNYKYISQQRNYLSHCGNYIPQINSNGWMVFNQTDNNIYKIKLNGDSLTQLTTNSLCSDPKWDYTNQFIYCYQSASGISISYLLKMNLQGQIIQYIQLNYPNTVPSKSSNKLYYLKPLNNKIAIYLTDLSLSTETLVLSSDKIISNGQNDFFNLNIDNKEEYLYWTNASGVLRFNLRNQKTDTVLKNCPNYTFLNPMISADAEELTFSCRIYKPYNALVLIREYRTFEMNLNTKEWRELKFFAN